MKRKKITKTIIYPEQMLSVFAFAYLIYEKYHGRETFTKPEHWIAAAIGLVLIFLRSIISGIINALRRNKLSGANIESVCKMKGVTFEDYCRVKFEEMGYKTEPTPKSHDYGADIIMRKRGQKVVVQCKRYNAKIGIAAIQQALGAKGYYNADKVMVVTNSFFTKSAKELALANNVELWDRQMIQQMWFK